MNRYINLFFSLSLSLIVSSCESSKTNSNENSNNISSEIENKSANLLTDYIPLHADGDVNAVIEIPTGTLEKWEFNKSNGQIEWEAVNNVPRIVNYLGYPGNYGMIPRTLLSKEHGGDGDPLDIIVLGPGEERGSIIKCKIIGVLYLMDREEQDDKLIAISINSPLYETNSIDELNEKYIGISEILKLWFTNYKGPGIITTKGFGNKNNALDILKIAINEYELSNTKHN
ncbi:MAG: inorganic diphosphatase [Bacteroidales bacterium]|nr:inorganic diphosphatase [Bacteroidales bacterium]